MKVKTLIKLLEKIHTKKGNIDVVIDYDEHGWYGTEKVELRVHKEDDDESYVFINIKSSNEI